MNKEFVTYEQALALKELGFDEECFKWYHNPDLLTDDELFLIYNNDNELFAFAPLKQQVFRWFREKYNLYSAVNVDQTTEPKFAYCISSYWHDALSWGWDTIVFNSDLYYEYEEAENACIDKLIEIAKQQEK
jgi:hypothetical protein